MMIRRFLPLVLVVLAGCAGGRESNGRFATGDVTPPSEGVEIPMSTPPSTQSVTRPATQPALDRIVFGQSVQGRPIEAVVVGEGEDTRLLMATIHGDENAGTPLLNRLLQILEERPELLEGKRLVIVPVANPDGFAMNIRYNANRVDLNRNFPADNRREDRDTSGPEPLSEPESRALHELIGRYRPWCIVTIHQPLDCLDYDGPGAEELARAMGEHSPLPVKKLGGRPGSLGSWAGMDEGMAVVTVELPRRVTSAENRLWNRYGPGLLAAITFEPSGGSAPASAPASSASSGRTRAATTAAVSTQPPPSQTP